MLRHLPHMAWTWSIHELHLKMDCMDVSFFMMIIPGHRPFECLSWRSRSTIAEHVAVTTSVSLFFSNGFHWLSSRLHCNTDGVTTGWSDIIFILQFRAYTLDTRISFCKDIGSVTAKRIAAGCLLTTGDHISYPENVSLRYRYCTRSLPSWTKVRYALQSSVMSKSKDERGQC